MRDEVLCVTPVTLRVFRDRPEITDEAAIQRMPLNEADKGTHFNVRFL
jgi:hypothetical protein